MAYDHAYVTHKFTSSNFNVITTRGHILRAPCVFTKSTTFDGEKFMWCPAVLKKTFHPWRTS